MKLCELDKDSPHWPEAELMFAAMYGEFARMGQQLALAEDGARRWCASMRKLSGRFVYLPVLVDGERLAGFLQASTALLPDYYAQSRAGSIAHLYIHPDYRKRGQARELVRAALEWFRKNRVDTVELQVLSGNAPAQQFWKACGFSLELAQYRMRLAPEA